MTPDSIDICPSCYGSGEAVADQVCSSCGGSGLDSTEETCKCYGCTTMRKKCVHNEDN